MRDKILCYILVLAFTLDDYILNLNDILPDLAISCEKVVVCCRYIGAKSSGGSRRVATEEGVVATKIYKLEAPLSFPKPRKIRK